jgi:hypothetical protein
MSIISPKFVGCGKSPAPTFEQIVAQKTNRGTDVQQHNIDKVRVWDFYPHGFFHWGLVIGVMVWPSAAQLAITPWSSASAIRCWHCCCSRIVWGLVGGGHALAPSSMRRKASSTTSKTGQARTRVGHSGRCPVGLLRYCLILVLSGEQRLLVSDDEIAASMTAFVSNTPRSAWRPATRM